jgi:hypothetical protein
MYALIGHVKIKPGREDETLAMLQEHGANLVQGMAGSQGAYWARVQGDGELIQHSFWLFDTEENARLAETTFNSLRDMPEAPVTLVSADVCEVVGQV